MDICLMNIKDLKEHEKVESKYLERLKKLIRKDKILKKPIVVDKSTNVIIDGHFRFNSLKQLGCSKVPVFLIDYNSPEILVRTWRDNEKITKEDVLFAGLNGKKFPPKTSRNMIKIGNKLRHISFIEKRINIPLKKLRGD
ncbi:hypothetical protein A3K64_03785 [Candidatus Micrarchaeota archaeon RBG_16_36_9]|nr:MAG: hypothetical protein A3K64_03785 [Candidatus Micrarchaeota archaeon RBG_16_36_9]